MWNGSENMNRVFHNIVESPIPKITANKKRLTRVRLVLIPLPGPNMQDHTTCIIIVADFIFKQCGKSLKDFPDNRELK